MSVWQLPRITFNTLNSVQESRPVALITNAAAWTVVRRSLSLPLVVQAEPTQNDAESADQLAAALPSAVEAIYVVGDELPQGVAKLVAAKVNKPLVVVPTLLSSDSPFTGESITGKPGSYQTLAGRVPDEVLIDIELIRSAPVYYRATGIVDVLSSVTALMDWGYAAQKGKLTTDTQFIPWAAGLVAGIASQAIKSAAAIGKGEPEALKTLVSLLTFTVQIDNQLGHHRASPGMEHLLAEALIPKATPGELSHAEKIGPGILVASALNKKDSTALRTALEAAGVRLGQLKVDDIRSALNTLPDYARQVNAPYTILNDLQSNSDDLAQALAKSTLIA